MIDKWDKRFYGEALREIATWSKDPDVKVGAIIVSEDHRRFSKGFNGFARGIADTDERLNDKIQKNELMIHAELNAIFNATENLTGWTLYTTRAPCINCANAIIQVGIKRVVGPDINHGSSWMKNQFKAKKLLLEAKVEYDII